MYFLLAWLVRLLSVSTTFGQPKAYHVVDVAGLPYVYVDPMNRDMYVSDTYYNRVLRYQYRTMFCCTPQAIFGTRNLFLCLAGADNLIQGDGHGESKGAAIQRDQQTGDRQRRRWGVWAAQFHHKRDGDSANKSLFPGPNECKGRFIRHVMGSRFYERRCGRQTEWGCGGDGCLDTCEEEHQPSPFHQLHTR